MYADIIKDSSLIQVINEELSESGDSYSIVVRVLNEDKWKGLIQKMLIASHKEETFGVIVKQEFYVNTEGSPAFVWTIMLWGDLEEAQTTLTPILEKRGAPPPPPASMGVSPVIKSSTPTATASSVRRPDGTTIGEVALPFGRADKKIDRNEVIKVGELTEGKKIRAYVDNYKGG